ncbi:MAG: adenine phosphoribosyltransferase [Acidobacteriaceae bacterium]|nr:adenine phosphoribosyltransferase [Acidobacteriaceae bacterium]
MTRFSRRYVELAKPVTIKAIAKAIETSTNVRNVLGPRNKVSAYTSRIGDATVCFADPCYNRGVSAPITALPAQRLKDLIREVPDFPKPGINFYDITTLLKDKKGFRETVDTLQEHYHGKPVDIVVGIEARGYFFAPAMAHALCAGFVPVRKPKKLPHVVKSVEYQLEYGTDQLEVHADAIEPGQRVLIIDDVLATGGTASAVARLVRDLGGEVAGLGFVIELTFLKGRGKLADYDVFSLLQY